MAGFSSVGRKGGKCGLDARALEEKHRAVQDAGGPTRQLREMAAVNRKVPGVMLPAPAPRDPLKLLAPPQG